MDSKKYLQYLLALLGTPGTAKDTFRYYSSLPYAKDYGMHIIDKSTGNLIEVKSRLGKSLKVHLPQHLLNDFSVTNPIQQDQNSDTNSIELVLQQSLQLDPSKRPSFDALLASPFFLYQFPSVTSDHMMDVGRLLEHLR